MSANAGLARAIRSVVRRYPHGCLADGQVARRIRPLWDLVATGKLHPGKGTLRNFTVGNYRSFADVSVCGCGAATGS